MRKFWSDILYLMDRRDLAHFGVLVASLVINSALELAALASVPFFMAVLLSGGEAPAGGRFGNWFALAVQRISGVETPFAFIVAAGALVLLLNTIRMLWTWWCIELQARMLANRRIAIAGRLLRAYLLAPAAFAMRRNSSDLVNRVIVESERLVVFVLSHLADVLHHGAMMLCIVAMLLCWIPAMTIAALLPLLLFGGGFYLFHRNRLRSLGVAEQSARTTALTTAAEAVNAREDATLLGCRNYFLERLHRSMSTVAAATRQSHVNHRLVWPYLEFVSMAVLLCVTLFSLATARGDLQQVGPRVALLAMALVRLRTTGVNIMAAGGMLRFHRASLAAVVGDLRELEADSRLRDLGAEDAAPPCPFQTGLAIRNLHFQYHGADQPLFDGLDLDLPKGASIGIVGATGSGKSTLLKLMLGLMPTDADAIKVDGRPIAELGPAWQHAVGYVPQEIFLLDDTLEANIALGVPPARRDAAALARAVQAAQLGDFVAAHPEGLGLVLGERGVRLSGGQRQRVGIARALYHAPPVLFFDEATSALDNTTEAALTAALAEIGRERTLVVVAHRLTTIRNCDRIYVLDQGKVVGAGTYEELYQNCPQFRQMASLHPETSASK